MKCRLDLYALDENGDEVKGVSHYAELPRIGKLLNQYLGTFRNRDEEIILKISIEKLEEE